MAGQIVEMRPKVAFAFETVTASNGGAAVGLTAGTYKPASGTGDAEECWITLATGDIRYRYDGSNPTTSVGHVLQAGRALRLKGQHQMANFKAIASGAADGVMSVSYERT